MKSSVDIIDENFKNSEEIRHILSQLLDENRKISAMMNEQLEVLRYILRDLTVYLII